MSNIFDKYVEENELSFENILKYVDAYSIYIHYIGEELEIGTKYSSPLSKDENPSFALYFSRGNKDELMFKDHSTGISGNALTFVKTLLGISSVHHTLLQINSDFGLHFSNVADKGFKPIIVKRDLAKLKKDPVDIQITSKDYPVMKYWEYWGVLDISIKILDMYFTKNVAQIHFTRGTKTVSVYPRTFCISYEINGFYKLYQPTGDRQFKFTNNYPYGYVEGALQLTWKQRFVIITKSMKECMFFRQHFGWDACAGTSENSMITPQFMQKLFEAYDFVLIWLDNDPPGLRAQAKYIKAYSSILSIPPSRSFIEKDPTDMYSVHQDHKQEVLEHIKSHVLKLMPHDK